MSLETVSQNLGQGGAGLPGIGKAIYELQRLRMSIVTGAAAGTKMNIAAMRTEDTILGVAVFTDAGGAVVDDTANVTIQGTTASGTITISGNPVADETLVVNGNTYTFKAAPTDMRHVLITTGDNTAMALSLKNAINAYESRYVGKSDAPDVVATSALGVVTVTAAVDGAAGNSITLTEAATNVAVSGSGTLTNGTDTGGIKSTTNLSSKTAQVFWYDKR